MNRGGKVESGHIFFCVLDPEFLFNQMIKFWKIVFFSFILGERVTYQNKTNS